MDINDKIAKHTGLIYKQLTRFGLLYDQDAESYAYEALYKAIVTFDEKAGAAFSTYAVCCINNALHKHVRSLNKKRQLDVVSYDAPIVADSDNRCLADVLEHPISVEQALVSEEASRIIRAAFMHEYELLPEKHKQVIRMFYDDTVKQKEIASTVGVSQPTVSKVVSAFKHRVKLRMEEYE